MYSLELIENSKNILIIAPKEIEGDNFCAAFALFYTLNKLGKNVNLSLPKIMEKLKFLATQELLESLNQNGVTISINTQGEKIEKIFYEKDKNELKFNLDLKNGDVSVENISFKIREKADLIINIENNDIFLENKNNDLVSPLVADNGRSYAGVCEKIIYFLKSFDEKIIDNNIATCLLTGLVSATQNFQNDKAKSLVLGQASYLIERGANYQKIIQFLYKTRSISEVKLLSRVLSRLNLDQEKNIAWCLLSEKDFSEINASSKNLSFVIESLKTNFTLPQTLIILWEQKYPKKATHGVVYSLEKELLKIISENFPSMEKNNCIIFAAKNLTVDETADNLLNKFNLLAFGEEAFVKDEHF